METSNMYRTRHCAPSASSPALTFWRALPVTTGAVRPDGAMGFAPAAADATVSTPGPLAWSPPI